MTQDEATALAAKLLAAYPYKKSELTAAVYVERFLTLDYDSAREAVNDLIDTAVDLPAVARVREQHDAVLRRKRMDRLALSEPDLTDEQTQENIRRANEYLAKLRGESTSDVLRDVA